MPDRVFHNYKQGTAVYPSRYKEFLDSFASLFNYRKGADVVAIIMGLLQPDSGIRFLVATNKPVTETAGDPSAHSDSLLAAHVSNLQALFKEYAQGASTASSGSTPEKLQEDMKASFIAGCHKLCWDKTRLRIKKKHTFVHVLKCLDDLAEIRKGSKYLRTLNELRNLCRAVQKAPGSKPQKTQGWMDLHRKLIAISDLLKDKEFSIFINDGVTETGGDVSHRREHDEVLRKVTSVAISAQKLCTFIIFEEHGLKSAIRSGLAFDWLPPPLNQWEGSFEVDLSQHTFQECFLHLQESGRELAGRNYPTNISSVLAEVLAKLSRDEKIGWDLVPVSEGSEHEGKFTESTPAGAKARWDVHCESHLLVHIISQEPGKAKFYPHIACSKLSCVGCFLFLQVINELYQLQPPFQTSSHGKVYVPWKVPEISGIQDKLPDVYRRLSRKVFEVLCMVLETYETHQDEVNKNVSDSSDDENNDLVVQSISQVAV